MSILRFDELKAVPWKNGLGITRDIAMSPAGAGMDDFQWRVSIADVDTASPFSVFPGVDRTIVLLDGDGFTMTLDDKREHALTTPCEPFGFPGEAHVDVQLAGGATRDFNLMVRRGSIDAQVLVLHGPQKITLGDDIALIHIAKGQATTSQGTAHSGDTIIDDRAIELLPHAIALAVQTTPSI